MFEAAHNNAPTSFACRPARWSARFAAMTPISAIIDNSSLTRSGQRGDMVAGYSIGCFIITWRVLMPLAFR